MRLKSAVAAAALLLAGGMFIADAQAQQVGTIYGFGDSLLDVSRNCPIAFPQSAPYGACGNGRGTLQWLSMLTSYSFNKVNDYAYNGVGNGVFPAFNGGPTVAQQIVEFTSAGRSFQPNDLIVIGGTPNNSAALFPPLGIVDPNGVPYTPQTLAAATLTQQYNNIAQLIKAGGHNFVVENNFSSSAYNFYVIGGFYPLGAPYQFPNIPGATTFFGLANANLAATLAPLARPGVRLHVVDLAAIYTKAYTDPTSLGFKTGTACIFDGNCLTASKDVQNQHFMFDLHPTDAGYAVIARYEANLLAAQDGIAAQGDIAQLTAQNFSNSMFSRLDAFRANDPRVTGAPDQAYASMDRPAMSTKAPPRLAPEIPLSVYLAAAYGSGSRGDRFSADGNAIGFDYTMAGGTFGADYKLDPNIRIGGALNYTNPVANLHGGTGHINVDSYQIGGFASFTYPHLLTDVVATYGYNAYRIDRPGVVDTIRGNTTGDTFTAGFKSAYLFDVGRVRLGPLVGLLYDYTNVNPYTETGDPIITQAVARQTLQGLTGSVGVQIRTPFVVGMRSFSSFLNLTAEHDFLGGARTLLAAETAALALPIYTMIPGNPDRTYGKAVAGLSTALSGNVSGMLTAAGTFGNSNPQFALQGALKVAF